MVKYCECGIIKLEFYWIIESLSDDWESPLIFDWLENLKEIIFYGMVFVKKKIERFRDPVVEEEGIYKYMQTLGGHWCE